MPAIFSERPLSKSCTEIVPLSTRTPGTDEDDVAPPDDAAPSAVRLPRRRVTMSLTLSPSPPRTAFTRRPITVIGLPPHAALKGTEISSALTSGGASAFASGWAAALPSFLSASPGGASPTTESCTMRPRNTKRPSPPRPCAIVTGRPSRAPTFDATACATMPPITSG